MESLFEPRKKKDQPKAPSPETLRDQAFRDSLRTEIESAEWAPQLFSALTELTFAELEGRSTVEDDIPLYKQLMERTIYVAVKEGNELETQSSQGAIGMQASIQVGLEASRIIREYTTKITPKNISR